MKQFRLIGIEINNWNGFTFDIFQIETKHIDAPLFGIWIANKSAIITLFWVLEIKLGKTF